MAVFVLGCWVVGLTATHVRVCTHVAVHNAGAVAVACHRCTCAQCVSQLRRSVLTLGFLVGTRITQSKHLTRVTKVRPGRAQSEHLSFFTTRSARTRSFFGKGELSLSYMLLTYVHRNNAREHAHQRFIIDAINPRYPSSTTLSFFQLIDVCRSRKPLTLVVLTPQ